ncbi:MAG: penicillin-binding protein 2 [Clostridia bacterium]|nr:penicillin-binding protein 2 [Clostridia bacterium]
MLEHLRQKRIIMACLMFFGIYIPLLFRLGNIQLINGSELSKRAFYQRSQEISLEMVERGNIYDRKLRSLSDSGFTERLVVFPVLVKDKNLVARQLATLLGVSVNDVQGRLEQRYGYWPYDLTLKQIQSIKDAKIPGVLVMPVRFRYGPQALAVNLTGYLGKIESLEELQRLKETGKNYRLSDSVGKMGLERYYELELKGSRSERAIRALVDAQSRLIPGLGIEEIKHREDADRRHLVLTLDRDIQQIVEEVMKAKVKKGTVVVMDAKTGDLLALASSPSYNQNSVAQAVYGQEGSYFERTVDRTVLPAQPGSVFKVVVGAAALDNGLADAKRIFECKGMAEPIKCQIQQEHRYHSLATAMALSCNPTFAKLGLELGSDTLIDYARRFGLDTQKVIGYPFRPYRLDWSKVGGENQMVNSSIGQGPVMASPVQITAMMNTIANGGMYIEPRLAKEIRAADGRLLKIFPLGKSHRAISPEAARYLQAMMAKVVREGTGTEANLAENPVAGKTGSAQVTGRESTVNAWFTGYAPVDDPRYTITVLVEEGQSGGQTAAPVFREILEGIS